MTCCVCGGVCRIWSNGWMCEGGVSFVVEVASAGCYGGHPCAKGTRGIHCQIISGNPRISPRLVQFDNLNRIANAS